MTSVTIPNSVTKIGDEVFQNCSALASVTIPNSVTYLREYVFEGCKELFTIVSLIENPSWIYGKSVSNRTFSEVTFEKATLYVP